MSSLKNVSTFFSVTSLIMISSFSTLTYGGSLYLQKKTRISFERASGRFCRIRLILRRATHWTSGAEETSVTVVVEDQYAAERRTGRERTEGRGHLAEDALGELLMVDVFEVDHDDLFGGGHGLMHFPTMNISNTVIETHLDRSEHDAAIRMLKLWYDSLANMLSLLLVLRRVLCDGPEDRNPAPLGALAKGNEEAREGRRVELEDALVFGRFLDLSQCEDRVGDDLWASAM